MNFVHNVDKEFCIGIGDGGRGARAPPQKKKNWGKYFLGNYVKFGHFGAKVM